VGGYCRRAELRFFGGLEIDDVAVLLAVFARAIDSDRSMARAWLQREPAP